MSDTKVPVPRPAPEPGYSIVIDTAEILIDEDVRVWNFGEWASGTVRGKDSNLVIVRPAGVTGVTWRVPRFLVAARMPVEVQEPPGKPPVGVLDVHVQALDRRIDSLLHEVTRGLDSLDRIREALLALRREVDTLPRRRK